VLTKGEMNDLSRQVEELNANVREMMRGGAQPRKAKPARRQTKSKAKKKKAAAKA
jgi:outer membrane murein-binding lipoprotein Lpp